jgi:hypothetical protein
MVKHAWSSLYRLGQALRVWILHPHDSPSHDKCKHLLHVNVKIKHLATRWRAVFINCQVALSGHWQGGAIPLHL